MFYVVLCHCVEGWMDTGEQLYIMCRLESVSHISLQEGESYQFHKQHIHHHKYKHSKNHALASHESLCPADQLAQLRILRNYTNQPITSTSQQFMENPLGNCGFSIPEQFTTRKKQRSRDGWFRPQRPSELRTRVAALPSKPPTSLRIRPGRCNLCWEVMTWICFTSPKKEIRYRDSPSSGCSIGKVNQQKHPANLKMMG